MQICTHIYIPMHAARTHTHTHMHTHTHTGFTSLQCSKPSEQAASSCCWNLPWHRSKHPDSQHWAEPVSSLLQWHFFHTVSSPRAAMWWPRGKQPELLEWADSRKVLSVILYYYIATEFSDRTLLEILCLEIPQYQGTITVADHRYLTCAQRTMRTVWSTWMPCVTFRCQAWHWTWVMALEIRTLVVAQMMSLMRVIA